MFFLCLIARGHKRDFSFGYATRADAETAVKALNRDAKIGRWYVFKCDPSVQSYTSLLNKC